jgi:hypothetical protein
LLRNGSGPARCYGALYVIVRPSLVQCRRAHIPVLHLGRLGAIDVRSIRRAAPPNPRNRRCGRNGCKVGTRPAIQEAALTIDTVQHSPDTVVRLIDRYVVAATSVARTRPAAR